MFEVENITNKITTFYVVQLVLYHDVFSWQVQHANGAVLGRFTWKNCPLFAQNVLDRCFLCMSSARYLFSFSACNLCLVLY
jgi:hypothetical protein